MNASSRISVAIGVVLGLAIGPGSACAIPRDRDARAQVAALLLTGELDPITPPRYAEHDGSWSANPTMLGMPFRSHSDTGPCVTSLIEAFVVSGGGASDPSCLARTPPIRFDHA
jgi:hypothetical protein